MLVELSAEIDKGRFYLPNTETDSHGQYKPAAYRGFRAAALNHVVNCYNKVKLIDYNIGTNNTNLKEIIMNEKRHFVSSIHEELDPVKFEREIKQNLIKSSNK